MFNKFICISSEKSFNTSLFLNLKVKIITISFFNLLKQFSTKIALYVKNNKSLLLFFSGLYLNRAHVFCGNLNQNEK